MWMGNEILTYARMKSAAADEIFGFASDEIKSAAPPCEAGFHREAISSNEVGFIPPSADLVAPNKKHPSGVFFVWSRIRESPACGRSCGRL